MLTGLSRSGASHLDVVSCHTQDIIGNSLSSIDGQFDVVFCGAGKSERKQEKYELNSQVRISDRKKIKQ